MTKKISEWIKTQKIHLIGWSLFIFFEITLVGLAAGAFGKPLNYVLHYILNIVLFYTNAHLVLMLSFRKKKYAVSRLIMLMLIQVAVYIVCRSFLNYSLSDAVKSFDIPTVLKNYRSFFQSLWRGLFFIGLSCFYYLFITYKAERTAREEAERQKLLEEIRSKNKENELRTAKYDYLRAQINPHLLFNTLSFLYDSIRKHNESAGDAVMRLSELMRFSLDTRESNNQYPKLGEEIDQIENLIKLNNVRKDNKLFFQTNLIGGVREFKFIPLVIITLVENMFKHGKLLEKDHPGILEIKLTEKIFSVTTKNLINTKLNRSGFNTGMDNIVKRMELAYGNSYSLTFGADEKNYFNVEFTLKR
ncbi:sensor histidine kinase [Pedobacter soli]|uniref:Histidine kinase n=1 Tax=Pedobacter soli TaxID=390242 RepID=A0A1G6WWC3_9SPHI|nr:sensor histidine kinase [Pedobacter soli]SDD70250.1 Histidine kinase [Pedobacter soli]